MALLQALAQDHVLDCGDWVSARNNNRGESAPSLRIYVVDLVSYQFSECRMTDRSLGPLTVTDVKLQ